MHRHNNFLKYCKKRMSDSLITGIPKIINTKNMQRKSFKLVIFLMSITGFLWQSYTFVEIYLKYPVVQHVRTEYPEVFRAPAITLCNRNRLKRQLFCRAYPKDCGYGGIVMPYYDEHRAKNAWEKLCERHRKYCPSVKPENYEVKLPLLKRNSMLDNQSNEFLNAVGPQSQRDLVDDCSIERNGQSIPCNDSIMIQTAFDGFPYKCFTFISIIDQPNNDPENLSLSDYYSFELNMHPEEDLKENVYEGAVYTAVHDPRRLKNPLSDNMALLNGFSYRLYVTMQHREHFPPPYETNCIDYVSLWKKRGGRGPLSKTDCIQDCMIYGLMDQLGCVLSSIEYPNNKTLCPYYWTWNLKRLMLSCENLCHESCEVYEYFITSEVIDNLKDKLCNETDEHCRRSHLNIEIQFNRITNERVLSEPLFQSEELFSHIGGYMGMWLGISFITLFDLIEMLVDIIVYLIIKWRKMRVRIVSYADDKHRA